MRRVRIRSPESERDLSSVLTAQDEQVSFRDTSNRIILIIT